MGRHKSNGAGTYHGKHYYKEEELKGHFDLMFDLMDETNRRVIHDPPCRGSIPLRVIRKAVKEVRQRRRKMPKKIKDRLLNPKEEYPALKLHWDKAVEENDKQYRKEHEGRGFFEDLALQYPEEK